MIHCHLFSRWQVPLAADRGAAGAQPWIQWSVLAVQVQNSASPDTPGGGKLTCQRADHRWVTTGTCPVSHIIGESKQELVQCLASQVSYNRTCPVSRITGESQQELVKCIVSQVSHNRNLSSVSYHRWVTTGTCPVSRITGESQQELVKCLVSQVSHNGNLSSVLYHRCHNRTCPVSRITGESQRELVQCLVSQVSHNGNLSSVSYHRW